MSLRDLFRSISPGVPEAEQVEQLLSAVRTGEIKQARALLKAGVPVDCRDDKGATPLMLAVKYGDAAMAELLLEQGAALDARNDAGWTPLKFAVEGQDWDMMRLLARSRDWRLGDFVSSLPEVPQAQRLQALLQKAVTAGQAGTVALLMLAGADGDAVFPGHRFPPLWMAMDLGYHDVTAALLRGGADLNKISGGLADVALSIIKSGDVKAIETAFASGALDDRPKISFSLSGNSLLIHAIKSSTPEAVAAVVRMDPVLLQYADPAGDSPLHNAIVRRDLPMVKILLDAGADTRHMNTTNQSALNVSDYTHGMSAGGEIAEAVKKASLKFHLVDAAATGDIQKIAELLAEGADPNFADAAGETALLRACKRGDAEVIRLLIDHGAEVKRSHASGLPMLSFALGSGSEEAVRLLVKAGESLLALERLEMTEERVKALGPQKLTPEMKALVQELREEELRAVGESATRLDQGVKTMKTLGFRPRGSVTSGTPS
jgi:ankyrin repeat protein